MIHLTRVTDEPHLFGQHRLLLDSVDLDFPPGRYALLSDSPEVHGRLFDVLACSRPPGHGLVHHEALASWPIGRPAFVRGKLSGMQLIRFVCSLYGLDTLVAHDFMCGILSNPELLPRRVMEWPGYARQEFVYALGLIPEFQIYFIDHMFPVEETRFSLLWRSLFEEKLIGKTLILSSYRKDQLLDYCTKGLIYENETFRIDDDLEQCIQQYSLRQSREESDGGGEWGGDLALGEAESALF
jgi:capsular polysaccharide transport system ATP-binding protein